LLFFKLFSGLIFGGALGQRGGLLDRHGGLEAAQLRLEGVERATEVAVSDLQLHSIVLHLRLAGHQAGGGKNLIFVIELSPPGACIIKLITAVIYSFRMILRVCTYMPFQPSVVFLFWVEHSSLLRKP